MKGGDISNETPLRVVVTLDCILDRRPKINRVLGIPITSEEVTYNRQALSQFWRFAEKYEYRLELVSPSIKWIHIVKKHHVSPAVNTISDPV